MISRSLWEHCGDALFEDGELERCCTDLDRVIATFGGAELLDHLFRGYLRPLFARGRYMLARLTQLIPDPDRGPANSFGFLLNLAIKHLKQSGFLVKKISLMFSASNTTYPPTPS